MTGGNRSTHGLLDAALSHMSRTSRHSSFADQAASEPVRDKLGRSFAAGKRRDSVARVWIKPGTGEVVVNGRKAEDYFVRPVLLMILNQPFEVAGVKENFDVIATVKGGGMSQQAGAVKHGISKALQLYDPAFRPALKAAGFLTRDSRIDERMKFGKRKAKRSFQFSKHSPDIQKAALVEETPPLTVEQAELHRLADMDRDTLRIELSTWDIEASANSLARLIGALKKSPKS